MKIYPAIDIKDGNCVRLLKGDFDKVTVYNNNPVNVAKAFEKSGAQFLHVVDLNGAASGKSQVLEILQELTESTKLKIQFGGGVRDLQFVDQLFDLGIDRVIIGTSAIKDKPFTQNAVDKYGERIAVAVDVKNNEVAVGGWIENTGVDIFDFLDELDEMGVSNIIVTDISKDGTMEGPNLDLYGILLEKYNFNLVASGGISSFDDLDKLLAINVDSAIVGKAIYEGTIDLTTFGGTDYVG